MRGSLAVTLDILPGMGFVALWTWFLVIFLRARTRWSKWVVAPENQPTGAVDQERRSALQQVFKKYEQERQATWEGLWPEYIETLEVSRDDFTSGDDVADRNIVRKRVTALVRRHQDRTQAEAEETIHDHYGALGDGRYGAEIKAFEDAGKKARRIRRRRAVGWSLVYGGLTAFFLTFAAGVAFSVVATVFPEHLFVPWAVKFSTLLLILSYSLVVLCLAIALSLRELATRTGEPTDAADVLPAAHVPDAAPQGE